MEIRIQSIHFDASEQLQAFIQKKAAKLELFYDDIKKVEVSLKVVKPETAENKDLVLSLALSYGSQEEIRCCVLRIAQCVARGELHPQDIDRQTIESNLYTAGMPPVDLMIRTSGEMRLSNFLLWQSAYAELYFTPVLWPDFTKEDFREALRAYARRERRFGRTSDQCANDSIKHNANTNTRI